jgi:hypothetical protein
MTDYSAFYDQQSAGLVQRSTASSTAPAPASAWDELELDAPPTPTPFDAAPARLPAASMAAASAGPGPAVQARGYKFRIACDEVCCGEWKGRAELGVLDDSFVQLVFENDEPAIGVALDAISAVQLSLEGADAATAATAGAAAERGPGRTHSDADRLAGLSDFARQQAALAPRPPREDSDSSHAGPALALALRVRLDLELDVPLEPVGSARSGRLLRAFAPLEEAPAMGRLVQAVHAARSAHPAALALGVPAWAEKVPPGVYGGELRRLSELAIVLWTTGTVFWAGWQLYHNSDYVHAALEPFVSFVYFYFDKTLDMIDDYLRWLTLLFYAWFRPIAIVISSLWSSLTPMLAPLYNLGARCLPPIVRAITPLMGRIETLVRAVRTNSCPFRAACFVRVRECASRGAVR